MTLMSVANSGAANLAMFKAVQMGGPQWRRTLSVCVSCWWACPT
jgi:hypothetical protein